MTSIPKHKQKAHGLRDHLRETLEKMNVDERRSPQGEAIRAASEELDRILNLARQITTALADDITDDGVEAFEAADEILNP